MLSLFSIPVFAQEKSEDWPTYRRDNQRSGHYPHDLSETLHLQWIFQPGHPPKEAWPGTAQSDWWRKRGTPEPDRITFDKAFELVSGHGKVYFGSSADDQLYCLDLKTGALLWTFFAEAPIRLAPTIAGERLLFGSDDGRVYCLDAQTGTLLWKSAIPEAEQRHVPGNGRIISLYPVRTGILVRDDTAYFAAGIFPKNTGVWYCSLDIRTGKILGRQPLDTSPQGYLEERDGKIFAHTGRDPKGAFLQDLPPGTEQARPDPAKVLQGYPYAFMSTPHQYFGGGAGRIAMFRANDGSEMWTKEVDGKARSLAISESRLLVSTDTGMVYCYAAHKADTVREHSPLIIEPLESDSKLNAGISDMLEHLPYQKGYALVLDAELDNGALLRGLAEQSQMQIIGTVRDPAAAEALRKALAGNRLYGPRITIRHISSGQVLPYSPRTFNLITSASASNSLTERSVRKLLRPRTGMLWKQSMKRPVFIAPPLKGTGEWTHMYADAGNTACSEDTRVGSDLQLQWFGRPGPQHMVDRHLRSTPSLVKNGLLFIPGRDYILGVDAWNGTILWEKEVPDFRRIGALRDSGNMVLSDDLLYCATASTCRAFDVYNGQEKCAFSLPVEYYDNDYEWGYSAVYERGLIGSAVKKGGVYRAMSSQAIYEGNYGDNTKISCSDGLFALDRHSGKSFWHYQPKGSILNPSISISDNKIMFIESANPETLKQSSARMHYPILLEKAGAQLVCLDLGRGHELWRTPLDQRKGIQTLFTLAKGGRIVVVNSRNHTADGAKSPTVHFDVRVFKTTNGKIAWEQTRDHKKRPNLDHGEQDLHPSIVGDRLIAEPYIYELSSGKERGTFSRSGGCGTISASSSALYFRAGNIATYDLDNNKSDRITSVSRAGCWINMIPAGGLLLVPEGSSGCICNYAIQGSMAFAPADE